MPGIVGLEVVRVQVLTQECGGDEGTGIAWESVDRGLGTSCKQCPGSRDEDFVWHGFVSVLGFFDLLSMFETS